jgi:hypothetical protein
MMIMSIVRSALRVYTLRGDIMLLRVMVYAVGKAMVDKMANDPQKFQIGSAQHPTFSDESCSGQCIKSRTLISVKELDIIFLN